LKEGSGRLNLQGCSDILLRLSFDFVSRHFETKPILFLGYSGPYVFLAYILTFLGINLVLILKGDRCFLPKRSDKLI